MALIWLDTAFDPDEMQTIKVAFLSEDYFALAANSELGAAFALGPRVIALSRGVAYEVVNSDSTVPAVEIPEPAKPASTEEARATPEPETTAPESAPPSEIQEIPSSTRNHLPCMGGMLPLALLPILGIFLVKAGKRS